LLQASIWQPDHHTLGACRQSEALKTLFFGFVMASTAVFVISEDQ
jgi:hypothetical protein